MSRYEGASTEKANIIGVDLAKHVFQVHGACRDGSVAFRKKISRHIWICRSSFGCRGSLSSGLSGGSGLNLGPECLAIRPVPEPPRIGIDRQRDHPVDLALNAARPHSPSCRRSRPHLGLSLWTSGR